jgi:hypothetical protein
LAKKKRKRAMQYLEEDEINKEINLLKKLKKGKITEQEFEILTGEDLFGLSSKEDVKKFKKKKI